MKADRNYPQGEQRENPQGAQRTNPQEERRENLQGKRHENSQGAQREKRNHGSGKPLFYLRLAWIGIRKNKRFYLPYLLTCMGMVMMFYIIVFLATGESLKGMSGGEVMASLLSTGSYVIGFFSLCFLFYTNSFLIRRRKKEFGLYNILGMGKRNLLCVIFWENVMMAALSLAGGLAAGIAFSKLAELLMINIMHQNVNFTLSVGWEAVKLTLQVFGGIFLLLLLRSMWQIRLSKPVELLRSESVGEKPPRANYLFALAGLLLLSGAYYLAVVIENPLEAILWFFVAVIMVILATYLLFISGSVTLCRLLQKNKNYYYRTNHFVSVSSMVYRMKRNGAGLASICILCTMVLVMLTGTVCMYIGTEESLRSRYPRNILLRTQQAASLEEEKLENVRLAVKEVLAENGREMTALQEYRLGDANGCYIVDGRILPFLPMEEARVAGALDSFVQTWQMFLISLEDYNRLMGTEETLEEGEILIHTTKAKYTEDTLIMPFGETRRIKKYVKDFVNNDIDSMQIFPTFYLITPDFEGDMERWNQVEYRISEMGDTVRYPVTWIWYYGFDLEAGEEEQKTIALQLRDRLNDLAAKEQIYSTERESVALERTYFYSLYGGLFFLGTLLGIVFLLAAVLIIYYKQISEGYEDQSRFEIMQKVGMTKREIRKSINSQVLTVFFLPLLTAGVHLSFAFIIMRRMLLVFSLNNTLLLLAVAVVCFGVFGLFYVLVYHRTSRAYYHIVTEARQE